MSIPDLTEARILIVDDERANLDLLERVLKPAGYRNIESTTDPRRVPALCAEDPPDILLVDLRMPYLDGFQLMERLKSDLPGFSTPVLMLTSDSSRETMKRALSSGARDFMTKPASPTEIRLRVENLLEVRLLYRTLRGQNERLEEAVRERTEELERARMEILERLALAAEWRDDDTGDHTRRVGKLSARVARALGLPEARVGRIRRAAPLHDVGKIGIHDSILLKPGPLTPEEMAVMKTHTEIGAEILSGSRFPSLVLGEMIALCHHEWWDGSGYPRGLSGREIPLAARIVTVVDIFDSLTHDRVYKPAWSTERALEEIERERGGKLDPDVADVFLRLEASQRPVAQNGVPV